MPSDPGTLIHRWFEEVWNQGSEAAIDELLAPDAIGHGLVHGQPDQAATDFKVFWRNMRAAIPDARIRVEDTLAQEDKAMVRIVLEGTHAGDGLGTPPSGGHVCVEGVVIARFRDGLMVEAWNSWDQLGLLRQIGAIGGPPPADRFLAKRA